MLNADVKTGNRPVAPIRSTPIYKISPVLLSSSAHKWGNMNTAEIRGMLTATERPCVTNAPSLLGRAVVVVTSVQNSSGMEVPMEDACRAS